MPKEKLFLRPLQPDQMYQAGGTHQKCRWYSVSSSVLQIHMVGELLTGQPGISSSAHLTPGAAGTDGHGWCLGGTCRDQNTQWTTMPAAEKTWEFHSQPRVKETIKQRTPFAPALWMRWDSRRDFRTAPTCLCLEDPIRHSLHLSFVFYSINAFICASHPNSL